MTTTTTTKNDEWDLQAFLNAVGTLRTSLETAGIGGKPLQYVQSFEAMLRFADALKDLKAKEIGAGGDTDSLIKNQIAVASGAIDNNEDKAETFGQQKRLALSAAGAEVLNEAAPIVALANTYTQDTEAAITHMMEHGQVPGEENMNWKTAIIESMNELAKSHSAEAPTLDESAGLAEIVGAVNTITAVQQAAPEGVVMNLDNTVGFLQNALQLMQASAQVKYKDAGKNKGAQNIAHKHGFSENEINDFEAKMKAFADAKGEMTPVTLKALFGEIVTEDFLGRIQALSAEYLGATGVTTLAGATVRTPQGQAETLAIIRVLNFDTNEILREMGQQAEGRSAPAPVVAPVQGPALQPQPQPQPITSPTPEATTTVPDVTTTAQRQAIKTALTAFEAKLPTNLEGYKALTGELNKLNGLGASNLTDQEKTMKSVVTTLRDVLNADEAKKNNAVVPPQVLDQELVALVTALHIYAITHGFDIDPWSMMGSLVNGDAPDVPEILAPQPASQPVASQQPATNADEVDYAAANAAIATAVEVLRNALPAGIKADTNIRIRLDALANLPDGQSTPVLSKANLAREFAALTTAIDQQKATGDFENFNEQIVSAATAGLFSALKAGYGVSTLDIVTFMSADTLDTHTVLDTKADFLPPEPTYIHTAFTEMGDALLRYAAIDGTPVTQEQAKAFQAQVKEALKIPANTTSAEAMVAALEKTGSRYVEDDKGKPIVDLVQHALTFAEKKIEFSVQKDPAITKAVMHVGDELHFYAEKPLPAVQLSNNVLHELKAANQVEVHTKNLWRSNANEIPKLLHELNVAHGDILSGLSIDIRKAQLGGEYTITIRAQTGDKHTALFNSEEYEANRKELIDLLGGEKQTGGVISNENKGTISFKIDREKFLSAIKESADVTDDRGGLRKGAGALADRVKDAAASPFKFFHNGETVLDTQRFLQPNDVAVLQVLEKTMKRLQDGASSKTSSEYKALVGTVVDLTIEMRHALESEGANGVASIDQLLGNNRNALNTALGIAQHLIDAGAIAGDDRRILQQFMQSRAEFIDPQPISRLPKPMRQEIEGMGQAVVKTNSMWRGASRKAREIVEVLNESGELNGAHITFSRKDHLLSVSRGLNPTGNIYVTIDVPGQEPQELKLNGSQFTALYESVVHGGESADTFSGKLQKALRTTLGEASTLVTDVIAAPNLGHNVQYRSSTADKTLTQHAESETYASASKLVDAIDAVLADGASQQQSTEQGRQ